MPRMIRSDGPVTVFRRIRVNGIGWVEFLR